MPSTKATRKLLIIIIILAAILLLGLVLRLIHLGSKSLYVDEAVTVYLVMRPLDKIVPFMMQLREVHPPLYFWFVRIWMDLMQILVPEGFSFEAYMRLSSVVFGVLTIFFTYLLGRKLFSIPTGLIAAFLIAISTFHVYYSQELRMYPMLLFFMMLSFYCFLHLLEKPGIFPALAYIIAGLGALLTHYFALYMFIIQGLWIIFLLYTSFKKKPKKEPEEEHIPENERVENEVVRIFALENSGETQNIPGLKVPVTAEHREKTENDSRNEETSFEQEVETIISTPGHLKKALGWLTGALLLIAIPYLWWLQYLLKQTGHQDFTLRIQPGIADVLNVFTRMTFGETLSFPHIGSFGLAPLAAVIPLVLIGWTRFRGIGLGKVFANLWLLVPLGMTLVLSFTRFHVFEFKYFYIATPALWMLIAHSLVYPPGRKLPKLLVTLIIAGNLVSGWNWQMNPWYQSQNWRGAARGVRASITKGEPVIIHPSMMAMAFAYYFPRPELIMPMDEPDSGRLGPLIKNRGSAWIVTTPYHPYVRQVQLLQYLQNFGDIKLAAEFNNFNPANVIRVYHLDFSKDQKKTKRSK